MLGLGALRVDAGARLYAGPLIASISGQDAAASRENHQQVLLWAAGRQLGDDLDKEEAELVAQEAAELAAQETAELAAREAAELAGMPFLLHSHAM